MKDEIFSLQMALLSLLFPGMGQLVQTRSLIALVFTMMEITLHACEAQLFYFIVLRLFSAYEALNFPFPEPLPDRVYHWRRLKCDLKPDMVDRFRENF